MSGIQRYKVFVAAAYGGPYAATKPAEMGDYVLHSDHEAEVARLRAEVEGLRSFVADYVSAYRNGFDGDDHLLNIARSLLGPTVGGQDVE